MARGEATRSRRVAAGPRPPAHAGADLQAGELCEPGHDFDAPAEARCVAGRGANPHVERRERPERRAQSIQDLVDQVPAERAVVGEARRRLPRHDLEVEGHSCGERRDRHGLVVDRDDPLPTAHLLLDEVLEKVAALGAVGVGGEALSLARHGGGHERQRVQLRVRVRQRRARLLALVHDHVDVRGAIVCSHALAPH
jgi:hypothetical protein